MTSRSSYKCKIELAFGVEFIVYFNRSQDDLPEIVLTQLITKDGLVIVNLPDKAMDQVIDLVNDEVGNLDPRSSFQLNLDL